MKIRNVLVLGMVVFLLISTIGCSKVVVGDLTEDSTVIETEGAEELRTEVKMGGGKLNIKGETDKVVEATFIYNVEAWKPITEYKLNGAIGELAIQQPVDIGEDSFTQNTRYEWDLSFNDQLKTDLAIEFGAGKAELQLGKLNLESLDLNMGAGNAIVNFEDSVSLRNLDLKMGAGDLELDLRGAFRENLSGEITGGVGKAVVILPTDIGVRVDAKGGIGKIEADGFIKDGDALVNEAYGNTDVTVDLVIRSGIGKVVLEMR